MANSINLYQDSESQKQHRSAADYGLYSVVGVLILLFAITGGLYAYNKSLESNIQELKNEMSALSEDATKDEESLKTVNDTYLRFESYQGWDNELVFVGEHFKILESSIVPEAVVRGYEFNKENSEVRVKIASGSLAGISKQILSFRNDKGIISVRIASMGVEEVEKRQEFVAEAGIVYANMQKKEEQKDTVSEESLTQE